jgi:hypothetical protein
MITLGLSQPATRNNPLDNPSVSLSSIDGWAWMGDGGRGSDAGEVINDVTALKISSCYACIRVLSESTASLPVRLLKVAGHHTSRLTIPASWPSPMCCSIGVAPNELVSPTVRQMDLRIPPSFSTVTLISAPSAARLLFTPVRRKLIQSLSFPGLREEPSVASNTAMRTSFATD